MPEESTIGRRTMLQATRAILTYALCQRTLLLIACLLEALVSCNRDPGFRRSEPAAPAQNVAALEQNRSMPLPPCPKARYPMLQASNSSVGHHKVFLRWNASSSARQFGPDELGYCLYRTQAAGTAKDCPNDPKCEQVNVQPVRGTRCIDDLVKDRTSYYYVALAITSAKVESTTSEEAIAQVPAPEKQLPAPPDAKSYPSCRTSSTPQPAQR